MVVLTFVPPCDPPLPVLGGEVPRQQKRRWGGKELSGLSRALPGHIVLDLSIGPQFLVLEEL